MTSYNPLDGLTAIQEENIVSYFLENILKNVSLPDQAIFNYVGRIEPTKQQMYDFNTKDIIPPRQAEVDIYYYKEDIYNNYIVTLVDNKVSSLLEPKRIKCARPGYCCSDEDYATKSTLSNKKFRDALKRRGLTEYDIDNNLYLDVSLDGRMYSINDKCSNKNTSVTKVIYKTKPRPHSFYMTPMWNDGLPGTTAAYSQPIEGVYVIYDRRSNRVLKVIDNDIIVPIQKGNLDWNRPLPDPSNIKPLVSVMPEGPSYVLDGNLVTWADWSFRWYLDPIYGVQLFKITYNNRTTWRENPNLPPVNEEIIYKMNIAEIITAYGISTEMAADRNYLDINEYPARDFIVPLVVGLDVPQYADRFTVPVVSVDGSIYELENSVGLYERDNGVLWRHTDYSCTEPINVQGRSGRQLVLTSIHVISNYDYTLNWIFNQDGKIDFELIPSGVIDCIGTDFVKTNETIIQGSLVRQNVIGINHAHIANVRINFTGSNNNVVENEVKLLPVSKENRFGNQWVESERVLKTEKEAVRNTNFNKYRTWSVENQSLKNYLDHPVSYELIPSPTPRPIVNPMSRIGKRATYLLNEFHVTKFHDNEQYVMGKYPIEDEKDRGLGRYIKDNENIENSDVVVWYSFGFAHSPVSEQYPVMPKEMVGFSLVPHNFFNENPALYIPETFVKNK